jgi:hypothetical protein
MWYLATISPECVGEVYCNSEGLGIILLVLQTVEHHHTVRDSQGNEEITVTRQIGDKRYSVTTRIDSKGEKRQIENFVNIEKGMLQSGQSK